MARNKIAVYVWIVDTIESHRHITLEELNRLWCNSSLSDGNPIPRRTFFNYRNAIEEMFNINIQCNRSTFEYYIENCDNEADSRMHHWLLDTFSMTGMLSNSKDLSGRIIVEDVPSAREHLPVVIQAMREDKRIVFDYHPYTRSQASKGVVICPYFVKIFKQLWYVIGHNVADGKIKTYSLDRMTNLNISSTSFKMPEGFEPQSFFKDCYGITINQNETKDRITREPHPSKIPPRLAAPPHAKRGSARHLLHFPLPHVAHLRPLRKNPLPRQQCGSAHPTRTEIPNHHPTKSHPRPLPIIPTQSPLPKKIESSKSR